MNPISSVLTDITEVVEKYFPSESDKEKIQMMAQEIQDKLPLAQIGVDAIEAQNTNVFISGARPFVEWVCGISLAWSWFGEPILSIIFQLFGVTLYANGMDIQDQVGVLCSLFGIHAISTYGKVKGL